MRIRRRFSAVLLVALCIASAPVLAQPKPAAVAPGSYECWAWGSARMHLNLRVDSAEDYTDSEGAQGRFRYDPASGRVEFAGGLLDGAMPDGFYVVYHEPNGRPTFSFRSASDSEASFCEKAD